MRDIVFDMRDIVYDRNRGICHLIDVYLSKYVWEAIKKAFSKDENIDGL